MAPLIPKAGLDMKYLLTWYGFTKKRSQVLKFPFSFAEALFKEPIFGGKKVPKIVSPSDVIESLCNIFGEEELRCLQYDMDSEDEIEYELEVVVRRTGRKAI